MRRRESLHHDFPAQAAGAETMLQSLQGTISVVLLGFHLDMEAIGTAGAVGRDHAVVAGVTKFTTNMTAGQNLNTGHSATQGSDIIPS